MNAEDIVKKILKRQLQLGDKVDEFTMDTNLLGAIPELDSMGVVNIITALEEELGCEIDDDEIEADIFETFGSLVNFVAQKI